MSTISFGNLVELMRLHVCSKNYLEIAEEIKQLPASRILKYIFDKSAKLSVSLRGVDIDDKNLTEIVSLDLARRMAGIRANEDYRITMIFENLLKLRAQQEEGVIFVCGALHASGLLAKFKEQNMQDEVLYYFPHSSSRYDDGMDDIKEGIMNDTLLHHTHLLTQPEVRPFSKKIFKEITSKIKYKKEILDGNSHSQFLSHCFKTNFRAFIRPGNYVDAFVGFDDLPDIESVRKRASEVEVETHDIFFNERRYLVIPGVNIREIADKIRTIPPLP